MKKIVWRTNQINLLIKLTSENCSLIIISLTEKSAKLEVFGTQLMSPNSFLIVKNQQCIVFDNVLKIIIVYNFIAIIVT